jgi:hypothetical protein
MDDPRWQQFFVDPQLTQQRRYEAIRAVIMEGEPGLMKTTVILLILGLLGFRFFVALWGDLE